MAHSADGVRGYLNRNREIEKIVSRTCLLGTATCVRTVQ